MSLPSDRIPIDLNDQEIEIYDKLSDEEKDQYNKLTSKTMKAEFLAQRMPKEEPEPEPTEEPKEEPEPEQEVPPVEIENPPYPTYIQEVESEKSGQWVRIPAVPYVLVFKKIYRCEKHPSASKLNRGSIVTHLKAHHGLNLDGTELPKDDKNIPEIEANTEEKDNDENQLQGGNKAEIELQVAKNDETQLNSPESQLQGANIKKEINELEVILAKKKEEVALASSTEEPELLVIGNLNSEIAASATKIVQNIDLRFLYEKTKTIWPPEWDFATWITALVTYALNDFHIGATVWQDTEQLDEDKLKFLIQVKKDWEEKLYQEKVARENSIIPKGKA